MFVLAATKDAPTPVKQTTFVVPALAKRRILHKASHSHDSLPPASDGARAAPHVASAAPEVHLPPTERIEGLRRLDADVASSPLEPAPAPAGWQEAAESGQTAAGKASAPDSDAKGGRYGSIASPVSTPGPAPGVASLPQVRAPCLLPIPYPPPDFPFTPRSSPPPPPPRRQPLCPLPCLCRIACCFFHLPHSILLPHLLPSRRLPGACSAICQTRSKREATVPGLIWLTRCPRSCQG